MKYTVARLGYNYSPPPGSKAYYVGDAGGKDVNGNPDEIVFMGTREQCEDFALLMNTAAATRELKAMQEAG